MDDFDLNCLFPLCTQALALGHLHCFVTKVWLAKDSTSELDGRRVTRS